MKNGKHKIIRLIRLIRLTRLILGQKNKRLTEREARLTLKMGVSVFRVFRTNENPLTKCAAQQNVSFFVGFCFGF